jgi:hypothetical protein
MPLILAPALVQTFPNVRRNALVWNLRLLSSTMVLGQTRAINSFLPTTSPECSKQQPLCRD